MTEIQEQSFKKIQVIKEQIQKMNKQIEDEKQKSDQQLDNKNHFIKILEQKIFERFDQESQIRKEIERRLFSLIEDKFGALRIEISKESKNRFESIENLKNYLEVNGKLI